MNPNKRAFLVGKLGEDRVKELESRPAELSKALRDQGIEYKEVDLAGDKVEVAVIETKEVLEAAVKAITESESFKAISTALTDAKTKLEQLEATILEMGKTIKELQKTDDEKISSAIAPKVVHGSKRASESSSNILDKEKDKDLVGAQATPSWVYTALGVKPQ